MAASRQINLQEREKKIGNSFKKLQKGFFNPIGSKLVEQDKELYRDHESLPD